jgi:O-antigen/teichoic acid export membrane protein
MASENHHKKKSSQPLLLSSIAMISFVGLVSVAAYFALPGFILGTLFGNKYALAAPFLGWFAVAVSLFSVTNLLFRYLLSVQQTGISYLLLGLAIFLIIAILLYGTSISAIIGFVILAQLVGITIGGVLVYRHKSTIVSKE